MWGCRGPEKACAGSGCSNSSSRRGCCGCCQCCSWGCQANQCSLWASKQTNLCSHQNPDCFSRIPCEHLQHSFPLDGFLIADIVESLIWSIYVFAGQESIECTQGTGEASGSDSRRNCKAQIDSQVEVHAVISQVTTTSSSKESCSCGTAYLPKGNSETSWRKGNLKLSAELDFIIWNLSWCSSASIHLSSKISFTVDSCLASQLVIYILNGDW